VPGAEAAIARASRWLLDHQAPGGWWKGELQTNVTMDAEDLLLREFLGIRDERLTAAAANWIRSQQRADGTWANYHAGPADLSTCVESYVALKLAGDDVQAQHMRAAREAILGMGGVERARVFTHIWLALFGQWPWRGVPALPPEVLLLPPSVPLNVYDFACWARQTVVALTVVSSHRPVRPVPFDLQELRTGGPDLSREPDLVGRAFIVLDRLLHLYERLPVKPLRRAALRRVERWILERQEADGCW
jgi:squalene-hopene/tetraprenyl-beta-curcumene cyclase